MKRFLSILLAILMLAVMLPVTAMAAGNTVKVGGTEYGTLEAAIAAAEPVNGVITYEIYGQVTVTATNWVQVAKAGLTGLTKVEFVGKTPDAEILISKPVSVLADQEYDIDVSFEKLTLSHPNGEWVQDLGHATKFFTYGTRAPRRIQSPIPTAPSPMVFATTSMVKPYSTTVHLATLLDIVFGIMAASLMSIIVALPEPAVLRHIMRVPCLFLRL